ncbi:MAG: DegT/DnrJ/EryC1/StrS family aminotransferase [Verrucomicrobia bacterium]|nr:MAG: DegT/DnrJ/EryC1/StrS family aminotransferase [Verrucomicrobiota bacterium]
MSTSEQPALLGGPRACDFDWPAWPVHGPAERERLLAVLESGRWWYGEQVRTFERAFAAFQGARFGVSCTNGTTAIEMALRAVGVIEGDEVIVPPYTFIATASAVITVGAVPVFADIDPETLCLDPAAVAERITERTRAIIPVHVGGRMADMAALNALAARHGLAVVEDAAHAWGSQWQGRGAGTLGACGTFSFQVSKNITAGEGGILVTDNAELAELARSFSHCGRREGGAWYDHDWLGSNLRMTEFQAAVLLAQLERLPDQIRRREANARLLERGLAGLPGLRLPRPAPEMTRRSYHMFIFRVDEGELGLSRDRFLDALQAEGVPATEGWYRPLYRNRLFAEAHVGPPHGIRAPLAGKGVDYRAVACPVCERVCREAVWIPHPVLLAEPWQIERLIEAVAKVVTHAARLR